MPVAPAAVAARAANENLSSCVLSNTSAGFAVLAVTPRVPRNSTAAAPSRPSRNSPTRARRDLSWKSFQKGTTQVTAGTGSPNGGTSMVCWSTRRSSGVTAARRERISCWNACHAVFAASTLRGSVGSGRGSRGTATPMERSSISWASRVTPSRPASAPPMATTTTAGALEMDPGTATTAWARAGFAGASVTPPVLIALCAA